MVDRNYCGPNLINSFALFHEDKQCKNEIIDEKSTIITAQNLAHNRWKLLPCVEGGKGNNSK